ncbi:MAG TPA: glycosyltransferase family 4 protein, partial [Gemmataceae bacterium]|nr:glycosyltransferase family 4 protein [Gemmataceae bacterium]
HPWQWLTLPCNPIAWPMWADAGRRDLDFDVIHATAFPYAFPIACGLRLARRLRVPFVLTPFLHLGDPGNLRDPVRRQYTTPALISLIRAADCVLVQTMGEKQLLEKQGIAPEKLVLQGLGVDPDECTGGDRTEIRRKWGVQPGEVVAGHLANNSREKGTIDLLQAASRIWDQGGALRVVLAGPEMPNFQSFWKRFATRGRVLRLGVLDAREKQNFFAGIDLFALPSRSDSFGLVLLEAWANGLPNIAYRAGGIADVVRDGQDGLLVPCGNINALVEGLTRLLADSELRTRLGQAGKERLPRDFRWEDKLQKVRDVYERLVRIRKNSKH